MWWLKYSPSRYHQTVWESTSIFMDTTHNVFCSSRSDISGPVVAFGLFPHPAAPAPTLMPPRPPSSFSAVLSATAPRSSRRSRPGSVAAAQHLAGSLGLGPQSPGPMAVGPRRTGPGGWRGVGRRWISGEFTGVQAAMAAIARLLFLSLNEANYKRSLRFLEVCQDMKTGRRPKIMTMKL